MSFEQLLPIVPSPCYYLCNMDKTSNSIVVYWIMARKLVIYCSVIHNIGS
ncbi:hypothetical protein [Bacillus sp. AFS040349]|nr:hypothetical protein [Bacillus sp. AFS040349]